MTDPRCYFQRVKMRRSGFSVVALSLAVGCGSASTKSADGDVGAGTGDVTANGQKGNGSASSPEGSGSGGTTSGSSSSGGSSSGSTGSTAGASGSGASGSAGSAGGGAGGADGGASTGGSNPEPAAASIAVRVHYPTGFGHRITLHCGGGSGGSSYVWTSSIETTWTAGDIWTASLPVAAKSTLACKPLFDDATWAIGPNWTFSAGVAADVWPHFFHTTGSIEQVPSWHSNILNDDRGMWIYTPASYSESTAQTYPVVYMHDGQNLFVDADSFGGVSWNVGGAMDDGVNAGTIHEAIVVGIDNDANRIPEYTPVADPDDGGGNADQYLAFIIQELKPQIDAKLRTESDRAHTTMVGSSLGALVSLYAGIAHPDVFGNIGALSPSTWWDNNWVIGASQSAKKVNGAFVSRLYLDSGDTGDSNDDVTQTAQLDATWKANTTAAVSIDYLVQHNASHSETYWRQRLPGALAFLLGGRDAH